MTAILLNAIVNSYDYINILIISVQLLTKYELYIIKLHGQILIWAEKSVYNPFFYKLLIWLLTLHNKYL